MSALVGRRWQIGAVFAWATIALVDPATAIDAAVAKRCDILLQKAFPPRQIGNPAAGSAKGNAVDQRAYFAKCVAQGGKVDGEPAAPAK